MKNRILPLKTPILLLFTFLCAAIASVQMIHAATITVTSTAGSGPNTLRQALADASDGDTINVDPVVTGVITLSGGELLVDKSVTISGPGANILSVNGNYMSRVFYIASGKTVTISGLTITQGGNAALGAGIYNDHSTLTVNNSTVSGNQSFNVGGGLYNDHGTLTVSNSTVSGNLAGPTGYGGGIYNDGTSSGSATLTVSNSTFSGNNASCCGGGILSAGPLGGSATVIVNNSTFTGNGFGSITISGNGATLTIRDTILDGGGIGGGDGSTLTSLGYNLSTDDGGGYLTATGDQINTDPMLGPLQNNGGLTFTHALSTGSPAINAGDPSFTPPPNYDQRGPGFDRVVNGRIDIGAFEVQATAYAAQIQQPIDADGTSVFNVRRGVVPVKFTLTLNGAATCQLPSATIAVTRTAGGVIGPIDESSYTGPADTGSNFRIDSCQYIYNLSASALGVGTYLVDIIIDGQVVGSATFALR
jgi:Right handed beta helix region